MPTEKTPQSPAAPSASFAAEMEAFGGFSEPTLGDAAKVVSRAAPKVAPKQKSLASKGGGASPAATPSSSATADRQAQLLGLAEEAGFVLEGNRIVHRERAEFQRVKAKADERTRQLERQILDRLNRDTSETKMTVEQARRLAAAHQSKDFDAIARELGLNDWNGLQEDLIAKISDPSYTRLRALEQAENERRAQVEQQRRQHQRQLQAQQQAQALQEHTANLSAQMQKSADPLVRELHDDPQFIRAVIEVQRQNWDGRSTVSPERAIKIAAQGFTGPLEKHMRGLFEKLHRAFGTSSASTPSPGASSSPRVRRPSRESSEGGRGEGSPSRRKGKSPERAAMDAEFSRMLQVAIAQDGLDGR